MIKKIDPNDSRPVAIIDKINEIVEAYNQLEERLNSHFHYTEINGNSYPSTASRGFTL